jgi:hypothetical protein
MIWDCDRYSSLSLGIIPIHSCELNRRYPSEIPMSNLQLVSVCAVARMVSLPDSYIGEV